jgi:hypothetical protein
VALISDLLSRVRTELADQPRQFRKVIVGDANTVDFVLGYKPVDPLTLLVTVNGTPIANPTGYTLEANFGVIHFVSAPSAGATIEVTGSAYRYFNDADLSTFINTAVTQHTYNKTDSYGSLTTLASIQPIEEYPVALLAVVEALWALATDAAFDIDISAPDGVSIPRSERYRQLSQTIQSRMDQYTSMCRALNIGIYRIEIGVLRRVSRTTNKLIPVYVPQEIDDSRRPERVYIQNDLLGRTPPPAYGQIYDLVLYQGDSFACEFDFPFNVTGYNFAAQFRTYPNAPSLYASFTITVLSASSTVSKVKLSLDKNSTAYLPVRGFWDLQMTSSSDSTYENTPIHGQVFVIQQVTLD